MCGSKKLQVIKLVTRGLLAMFANFFRYVSLMLYHTHTFGIERICFAKDTRVCLVAAALSELASCTNCTSSV